MRAIRTTLLFVLLGCFYLLGQDKGYQFKHLNTSDGLSQSSIIAMEQDTLGRMWLGTRDGLNLYDGTDFKVYRTEEGDTTSISNSDILAITEDSEGYIWVGTYNGLNRYDPKSDTFTRFFYATAENSLSNNTVWCITEMQNGELWIGTSNGLSIYDKKNNRFQAVYSSDSDGSLPSNYILSIAQTNDGTVWVGTSKGFCKATRKGAEKPTFETLALKGADIDPFIQTIVSCDKNSLCIGTKNMGMLKFDLLSERYIVKPGYQKNSDVRAIVTDHKGKLWLGTANGVVLLENDKAVASLTSQTNNLGGLSHNYIKSMLIDKKGSIWIGSYHGGIDIWDASNINFLDYSEYLDRNELGSRVVSAIVSDQDEKLYIATEGGGITILNTDERQVDYLNMANTTGLVSNNIKSLLLQENFLYIGSFNKGLMAYDLAKKAFTDSKLSDSLKYVTKNTGIYDIEKGIGNTLWLGTFGEGLIQYDLNTGRHNIFQTDDGHGAGLSSNRIRSLMIDRSSNVWVGTQSGLNLLPYQNGIYDPQNIKHFQYDKDTGSGDDILTIYQDALGVIWLGIRAKGLFRFDGKEFQNVPIRTTTTITSIYAISEDDDNVLWMSSNQGLIKYETRTDSFTLFTQKDGLAGNEFSSGAVLKMKGSKFYFGGPGGLSYFDARNIAKNDFSPQVILTDFNVKNEPISPKDENGILEQSLPYTKKVALAYDKANFSINYAIPNFVNPSSNQYQYRMRGLEENWTTTTRTQANYTIQKPGNYTFEVKGANNDGVWNAEPTSIQIEVLPAPWRSLWAFMLYGILLFGAIWGFGNIIRSRTKLKHELQLEHLKNQQNIENNDAKLRFFTNISHEFRTPLTLITGPLQQLLKDYKGSRYVYKKLLVMESNANHLLQLINRLMDFRKLEHERVKLETAEGNIVKFLREIYLSFTEFAKGRNYDYTFESESQEILVYYDRPKLEQVFYNLISNAFKYTPQDGQIAIEIRTGEKDITIDVKDSGHGIPEEYRERIFDRFFEIPEYKRDMTEQGTGTGIGLSIAKRMIELHKGSIAVLGDTDKGSIFRVTLPLGKEHLQENEIIANFKFSDDLRLYTSQLEQGQENNEAIVSELLLDQEKYVILLVEDNTPLRNFMKDLLKEKYNVLEAGDGQEAMQKALKFVPDLIVSDVIMPRMVGTELCAKIKENIKTSHIPVILLTSRTSLLYKFEGLESGADDYISKPFDVREFQLRIKNLIESSKRLRTKFSNDSGFKPNEIAVSSIDEELLVKALQIVEDNISNDQFDIPTFSSELGVSRTLLFTKTKAWTNMTPNEFIQEVRMKRAVQLLEQDKLNISQVSYKVGFKNPKYFSKCFQKKYGITPSSFTEKFSENFTD